MLRLTDSKLPIYDKLWAEVSILNLSYNFNSCIQLMINLNYSWIHMTVKFCHIEYSGAVSGAGIQEAPKRKEKSGEA